MGLLICVKNNDGSEDVELVDAPEMAKLLGGTQFHCRPDDEFHHTEMIPLGKSDLEVVEQSFLFGLPISFGKK